MSAAQTSGCVRTTSELSARESNVTDLSVVREYFLCENTIYRIGFQDYYGSLLAGGSDMIHLRPNLHLKCGASGSRDNNCLVIAGDVQLDGTTVYGVPEDAVDNVVITGVTFSGARQHMVWINKPGNVLFQDCVFRVRKSVLIPRCDPQTHLVPIYSHRKTPKPFHRYY
jgi:hypothetical protein